MIVICPSCSARFLYADERFQGAKAKRFQCPKCAAVFEVVNPALFEATITPLELIEDGTRPTETTSRKQRDALLAEGAGEAAMPPNIRFSLAFLTGPQASTVRAITTAVTLIGREEGDVITNDPEVSRRHARIEIHSDGTAWLSDLGSTNGTAVNGQLIDRPTQLFDRQEFSCGRSTFMLLIRAIDTNTME
jgi:uncharacterized protein YbaR (Trm112 family)